MNADKQEMPVVTSTLKSKTKLDYDRTYMLSCGLATSVDDYIGF